nr:Nramp family divalent metal transporter [uncultured Sphingomonas sp.]
MSQNEQAEKRSFLSVLGPGLVTGAADDDPSGIATYSQVGAQFGYSMAWTMPFAFPLLAAIQEICARVGAVTGKGIAQNLRAHYSPWLLRFVVVLLLIANMINLGADLGAMAAVLALVMPGPLLAYTLGFAVLSTLLEVFVSYGRYARVLKWATLSLFAYVGVLIVSHVDWGEALRGIVIPSLAFDRVHAMALVAVFGTTISPYLFFWQAGQEVEEQHRRHVKPLHASPTKAGAELKRIRTDTLVGMGFSHMVALAIILATAATLHQSGVRDIGSAADAAQALRPVAGNFAFALFAIGIIGTGLLAIPILAGSAAYAVSEMFDWTEGLGRKPKEAKAFYTVIAVATLGGVAINFFPIDPMRALYWAAVANGLLAPPLMVVLMLMARNKRVMGKLCIPRGLALFGWLGTAVMFGVAALFLIG